ncbi:SEC-C metal-binding domain-containing protein [Aeromonas veronii]
MGAPIKIGRNEPCPCGRGQEVQAVQFALINKL